MIGNRQRKIVPIRYDGDNPTGYTDKLYKTGTAWGSPGDIQFVTQAEALKFLQHADVFSAPKAEEVKVFLDENQTHKDDIEAALDELERVRLSKETQRENETKAKYDLSDALWAEINTISDKDSLFDFIGRQPELVDTAFDKRKSLENLKDDVSRELSFGGSLL